MNTTLWILQVLLAAVFLTHGLLYLLPPAAMRKTMKEVPFSVGFLRFIGVAEILGAFGLTLAGWTGILPWLTSLAAGLSIVVGGAVGLHLSRREMPQSFVTAIIVAAVTFIPYARWFVMPL